MRRQATQLMRTCDAEGWRELVLPSPEQFVLPSVPWGRFDEVFSPAFWAGQAWLHAPARRFEGYRLGASLREEVAACLLGGYGMPAEVALAAFHHLRSVGLLDGDPSAASLEHALSRPLTIRGRTVRYRFARQKAHYLAESLVARSPHTGHHQGSFWKVVLVP